MKADKQRSSGRREFNQRSVTTEQKLSVRVRWLERWVNDRFGTIDATRNHRDDFALRGTNDPYSSLSVSFNLPLTIVAPVSYLRYYIPARISSWPNMFRPSLSWELLAIELYNPLRNIKRNVLSMPCYRTISLRL